MFTTDDEELARARDVGQLIHAAIGDLAVRCLQPTLPEIDRATNSGLSRFAPIEARAHRQNVKAGIHVYFRRLLPPTDWSFHGAELRLGSGRADLVWTNPDGLLLLDEIKTGSPRQLLLPNTRRQIDRYRDCAQLAWPGQFVGVRLLSLIDPSRSLFIASDGSTHPLDTTDYLR